MTITARPARCASTACGCARPRPAPVAARRGTGRVARRRRGAGTRAATGVRIQASGPSWLVLGQSYDRGWRARCDGRDLGAPRPMQGYANALADRRRLPRGRFTYGLQRAATLGYVVSGARLPRSCSPLLAGLGRRRRPRAAHPPPAPLPAAPDPPRPLAPRRAAVVAVVAAAVLGFCFGLRAGVVLGAAARPRPVARRRGPRARISAGALLASPCRCPTCSSRCCRVAATRAATTAATRTTASPAHWLALAALTALGLVLWRTLASARAAPPPGDIGRARPPSRGH